MIETDHNNLLWMEASKVPKIIRWRIYLQSFKFHIKHIAGTKNLVADWLSRLYDEDSNPAELKYLGYLDEEDLIDTSVRVQPMFLAVVSNISAKKVA